MLIIFPKTGKVLKDKATTEPIVYVVPCIVIDLVLYPEDVVIHHRLIVIYAHWWIVISLSIGNRWPYSKSLRLHGESVEEISL